MIYSIGVEQGNLKMPCFEGRWGRELAKIKTINVHTYDIHKTTVTFGKKLRENMGSK